MSPSAQMAYQGHKLQLAEQDNEALQQENAILWRRLEVQREALEAARWLLVEDINNGVSDKRKNEILRVVRAALVEGETN